jgi:hypothetical protein
MYHEIKPVENVPLLLSVTDIIPYDPNNLFFPASYQYSNNIGKITNCLSDVTWNVNLKSLLGNHIYDEYDYFNLELLQFMTIPMTGSNNIFSKPFQNDIIIGYRNISIYISGLQWVNSSYSQKDDCNLSYCHLCNVKQQYNMINNNIQFSNWRRDEYLYNAIKGYAKYDLMFKKQEYVKINIRIGAIDSNLDYTPENIFSNTSSIMQYFILKFNIVPFK